MTPSLLDQHYKYDNAEKSKEPGYLARKMKQWTKRAEKQREQDAAFDKIAKVRAIR